MRFKLDENLPWSISKIIADSGHDVETVLSEGLGGCPDDQLINICLQEQRTLITLDYDFADIITYPPQTYSGIIVVRVKNQAISAIQVLIAKFRGALVILLYVLFLNSRNGQHICFSEIFINQSQQ